MVALTALGWKADAALHRSGGRVDVLAVLTDSVYLTAAGELVWLGRVDAVMHPRAMLTRAPLPQALDGFAVDAAAAPPWRAAPFPAFSDPRAILRAGANLVAQLRARAAGEPLGLGALLVGGSLGFPLGAAAPGATALADAAFDDAAEAAVAAAAPLLGLGAGLTPSGDDFVGGVLFARAFLAASGHADATTWPAAGTALAARARQRTHPISAALLGDLAHGQGHAPLHDLTAALAGGPGETALAAAGRLVRIGHSSGWDMLAGLLAGLLGRNAFG